MALLVPYGNGRDGVPALFGWAPSSGLDAIERDDSIVITADMPGVDDRDVDLTFASGILTVTATGRDRHFRYSYQLGDGVDPDRIDATLANGVLTVTAWKSPSAKPRKIPIAVTGKRRTPKRWLSFLRRR